jgi:UDP-N-acetyl-D-galactosamine dehydrogenase
MHEYSIRSLSQPTANNDYQVIVLAVSLKEFLELDMQQHLKTGALLYDIKGFLDNGIAHGKL